MVYLLMNSKKGLDILAFPCNQFGGQEPKSECEIKEFAQKKQDAQYKLFSKVEVNGPKTCDVYKFLRTNSELYNQETGKTGKISWNFCKFLVNKDGEVVNFYKSGKLPQEISGDVEKLL